MPERYSQDASARGCGNPALDELETDIDTDEVDELDNGERDLASTECIDQTHIGQGDLWAGDGEMDLASTNGIDQRWTHTGSRTDREANAFPYDPPKRLEKAASGGPIVEPPEDALRRVKQELRKRGLGGDSGASSIVELVRWRR